MGPATCQAMSVQAAKWDGPARDAYKGIKAVMALLVTNKVPCTVAIAYNYLIKGTFDGSTMPWVTPKDGKKLEYLANDLVSAVSAVLARHELALPKAPAPKAMLAEPLVVRALVPPGCMLVCGISGR